MLLAILAANVVNEIIKVVRRLLVEDTATSIEKCARQRATEALPAAPLPYFRGHMTGNIHGRLNRNLEGTSKLIKLVFMDFAPAVAGGLAAIVVIFAKLPLPVAGAVVLVIPCGTLIVQRRIEALRAQGATVLSIAHRLTTLENCDEILVMDKGRIVQRGGFAELRERPGVFRDMARGILH